jgi:hypothetical protein
LSALDQADSVRPAALRVLPQPVLPSIGIHDLIGTNNQKHYVDETQNTRQLGAAST